MNARKSIFYILMTALGVGLLIFGCILLKAGYDSTLPYLSIGLGCGLLGHGLGEVIRRQAVRNHPEAAKQLQIDQCDERNIALRNHAAAKAYQLMIYVFGALLVAFALMNADLRIILLLVAGYLLICGCYVYYYVKYDREM